MNFIRLSDDVKEEVKDGDVCCLNCKHVRYSFDLHKWYCEKTGYFTLAECVCDYVETKIFGF